MRYAYGTAHCNVHTDLNLGFVIRILQWIKDQTHLEKADCLLSWCEGIYNKAEQLETIRIKNEN